MAPPPIVRAALVWFALVLVYVAGLTLPAGPGGDLSRAEAHRLLVAHSIVTDGDVDLLDDYQANAAGTFGGIDGLAPGARLRDAVPAIRDRDVPGGSRPAAPGGFLEASGIGIGLVLAPGYAVGYETGLGGRLATQVWSAMLLALAFVLARPLARRVVPDPWATRGVLALALSPPAVLGATQISATSAAALLLVGALGAALAVRDHPRAGAAIGCSLLCALMPWLWLPLAPVALLIAIALARWMRRRRRGLAGFFALEVLLLSAIVYVTIHDRMYGGPTPYAGAVGLGLPTDFDGVGDALKRLVLGPVGAIVDRDQGLLRWAPILALAGVAAWRLVRSRRARLARVFEHAVHVEVVVGFLLVVAAAVVVPFAVLSPNPHAAWLGGPAAAPALIALAPAVAWGWQRAPRAGAVLATLTVVATLWTIGAGALDDSAGSDPPRGALPWGGVQRILPRLP